MRLGALEGALHTCSAALEWPFAAHTVGGPWKGSTVTSGACRIVRLGSGILQDAARSHFRDLWEFIRGDLSHGLDPPALEAVSGGQSMLLLGLRGREIVGLIWAKPTRTAQLCATNATLDDIQRTAGVRTTIGVEIIWVRRSERRRGVATALVDAVREQAASFGGLPVPREAVAFSQPTEMGSSFAGSYSKSASRNGRVLVYQPST